MPSDTNPLPAATLFEKADTMADAIIRSKGYSDPVRVMVAYEAAVATAEAYRAARAASPVTLEEALLSDEVLTGKELSHRLFYFAAFDYEERLEAEKTHNAATHARIEHAQRGPEREGL